MGPAYLSWMHDHVHTYGWDDHVHTSPTNIMYHTLTAPLYPSPCETEPRPCGAGAFCSERNTLAVEEAHCSQCTHAARCSADATPLTKCTCAHIDCRGTLQESVCGSDDRNYPSVCEMRRESCRQQRNIHKLYDGKCRNNGESSSLPLPHIPSPWSCPSLTSWSCPSLTSWSCPSLTSLVPGPAPPSHLVLPLPHIPSPWSAPPSHPYSPWSCPSLTSLVPGPAPPSHPYSPWSCPSLTSLVPDPAPPSHPYSPWSCPSLTSLVPGPAPPSLP